MLAKRRAVAAEKKQWKYKKVPLNRAPGYIIIILIACLLVAALMTYSGYFSKPPALDTVFGKTIVAVIKSNDTTYFILATDNEKLPLVAIRSKTGTELKVGDQINWVEGEMNLMPNNLLPVIWPRRLIKINGTIINTPQTPPPKSTTEV
jgi:hypothetical protein